MEESTVLSPEEVEAILHASKEQPPADLTADLASSEAVQDVKQYAYALVNINELFRMEYEKNLAGFLRKKIIITSKQSDLVEFGQIFKEPTPSIYSTFQIKSTNTYGLFVCDNKLLHQCINLLYGGKLNDKDDVISQPGRVGISIAEKIASLCMNAFVSGCREIGHINFDIIKTTPLVNLASNMGMSAEDQIVTFDLSIFIDEIELTCKLILEEEFLLNFIPAKTASTKHREKDFWRKAIKSQFIDSLVTISVTLPDVQMKISDIVKLKEGDEIDISDPTVSYVCLNNLKLFRSIAGQNNSKLAIKVVEQI